MKARVKATGEIIEIIKIEDNLFIDSSCCQYEPYEIEWKINNPDYWTHLEHTYAGMAMQGILAYGNNYGNSREEIVNKIAGYAKDIAHALVEKMKEERK